jgi:hypothetical protein
MENHTLDTLRRIQMMTKFRGYSPHLPVILCHLSILLSMCFNKLFLLHILVGWWNNFELLSPLDKHSTCDHFLYMISSRGYNSVSRSLIFISVWLRPTCLDKFQGQSSSCFSHLSPCAHFQTYLLPFLLKSSSILLSLLSIAHRIIPRSTRHHNIF